MQNTYRIHTAVRNTDYRMHTDAQRTTGLPFNSPLGIQADNVMDVRVGGKYRLGRKAEKNINNGLNTEMGKGVVVKVEHKSRS